MIAAWLLYGVLRWRGTQLPRDPRVRRGFATMGLLGAMVPFSLIAYGEIRVDSSLAAILIGAVPLFTVVFSHLFSADERLNWRLGGGVLLGFAGVRFLFGRETFSGPAGEAIAQPAILTAAACYAGAAVYARRLRHIPVPILSTDTMVAAAGLLLPVALIVEQPWTLRPSAGAVAAVALLGVVMTGLATLMFFRLIASAGATFATQVNYLIPAVGALGGVIMLGETLEVHALAALALILAGVAAVRAATRQRSDA